MIVEVKGIGRVQFPDSMSQEQIHAALRRQYAKSQPAAPLPHVGNPSAAALQTIPGGASLGFGLAPAMPTVGGAFGGYVGGMAGAGVGGAIGEASRQIMAGQGPRENPIDILKVGRRGLGQAALEGVGQGVAFGATKLGAKLAARAPRAAIPGIPAQEASKVLDKFGRPHIQAKPAVPAVPEVLGKGFDLTPLKAGPVRIGISISPQNVGRAARLLSSPAMRHALRQSRGVLHLTYTAEPDATQP